MSLLKKILKKKLYELRLFPKSRTLWRKHTFLNCTMPYIYIYIGDKKKKKNNPSYIVIYDL